MTKVMTRTFDFRCTLDGELELTSAVADALYEEGCDDASVHSEGLTIQLDFSREAESLGDAIASAVKDIERAGYAVSRIEMDAEADD